MKIKRTTEDKRNCWMHTFIREQGTSAWHRLAPLGEVYCGADIGNTAEFANALPADEGLCQRCAELFDKERRRRLGEVYALLIDLDRRHRAEMEGTTDEENAVG